MGLVEPWTTIYSLPATPEYDPPASAGAVSDNANYVAVLSRKTFTEGTSRLNIYTRNGNSWTITSTFNVTGNIWNLVQNIGITGAGDKIAVADYIYVRSGSTWSQQTILAGSFASSRYSSAMSKDGLRVAVSSWTSSQLLVYRFNGTSWILEQTITDPSGTGNYFGMVSSFNADGSTLAISAPYTNTAGFPRSGAVHVFTRTGTTWSQQASLNPTTPASDMQFGYDVSLDDSGNYLVISSSQPGTQNGVYKRVGTTWSKQSVINNLYYRCAISPDSTLVAGASSMYYTNTGGLYRGDNQANFGGAVFSTDNKYLLQVTSTVPNLTSRD